jgi:uncharacterized protein (TIRG00374 family)
MRWTIPSSRVKAAIGAALILLAIGFALAGLDVVRRSLAGGTVSAAVILALLPFAAWSYGLRTCRWHILVRSVSPGVSPLVSCYAQVVGFALSVSPGRLAELYKLRLIERGTGTSIAQTFPAVVAERLTDALVLGGMVLIGGMLHLSATTGDGGIEVLVALAGLVGGAAVFATRNRIDWHRLAERAGAFLDRQSMARRLSRLVQGRTVTSILSQLRTGGARVMRPKTIGLALVFVLLGRLGDGIVLWKISQTVGYPVGLPLALMIVGAAGLFGGASFSPGGVGAAEAALVGLITANGMPISLAIVAAFTTRALLFWLWVVLGLGALAITQGYPLLKRSAANLALAARGSRSAPPRPSE